MDNVPKLERSTQRWAKCDPKAMAEMSQAAIQYALEDAKHDIAALASQSAAWLAVLATLNEVAPGWCKGDACAMEEAVAAIRALAPSDAAGAPQRIGTVEVVAGRVRSYTFEQTDAPDGSHSLYAVPVAPAAVAPSEDAYVAQRMSETLAEVWATIMGDDAQPEDESLNAIERVKKAAQVLRLEVDLYRAQRGEGAALIDERGAFESKFPVPGGVNWDGAKYIVRDGYENSYPVERFGGQWKAWQARAAAPTPTVAADAAAQPADLVDLLIARARRTPYTPIGDYMTRLWLFNPYEHPSGLPQFPDISLSARLHHILRADDARHPHSHPWCATSMILRGWYVEERVVRSTSEKTRVRRQPGDVVRITDDTFHTIVEVSPDGCWTLFITEGKYASWGFLVDGEVIPWREYLGIEPAASEGGEA
jgi:hypothetical protein